MPDLGNAYVNIVPKAPGISSKIEGVLNEGAPGAEKAGQGFGKKIIGALGALGIGAAVGSMFKQAMEAGGALQQSYGGLETIYGEAAAQAQQFAMQAASAGISANDYAEQAVSFGAALKQAFGGDTAAAAEAANTAIMDMADNAAKMGTPLESLQAAYQGFAKQNYTMLDNLKLGYGGTKTEMERLLADAQAITGVEYNIDNLGDVYAAIHVIQGELGLTGVAAGEAETTLTGSAAAMKASWENLMGAMATGQGMEQAMENLTASVGNFATNVLSMLGNIAPQLPGLILGLADVILANAPAFIASGAELIAQLAVGLVNMIPQLVAIVPQIFTAFGNAFKGIDWASLGKSLIDGIIKGLSNAAGSLYKKIKEIIRKALFAGRDEAEVGSPSRLFADELGRWIPAGVAMGVEQNMTPLDRAMRGMMDGSLAAARGTTAAPAQSAGDADRIIAALQQLEFRPVVTLEGDAGKIFRVVQKTNAVRTKATAYNTLAAAGV